MGVGHFFGLMREAPRWRDLHRRGTRLHHRAHRQPSSTRFQGPRQGLRGDSASEDTSSTWRSATSRRQLSGLRSAYRRSPHLTRSIHDTSSARPSMWSAPADRTGTHHQPFTRMDKQWTTRCVGYLSEGAVLLGAIRLAQHARFAGNAGTDVTTDILFLQKRTLDSPPGESWLELKTVETGMARSKSTSILRPASGDDARPHGTGIARYGMGAALVGTG